MDIHLGDILTAENGAFYRVIECKENIISLIRLNGYTSFSCSLAFAKAQFQASQSPSVAYNRSI
ncbi:hypothetical protein C7B82_08970 [Stenomitos frigidus ULC18]|uniref:Uncharacterized protein n=2 Tax=Stenomitos TaxID=1844270 RepID=A0A2T1ECE1_9CYAN|nr:hypothetical protein C7B82_08970 [Stenomitos frigidus ULC18]